MPLKLKVDLHLHTADDLVEKLSGRKDMIPPKELVDMAVEQGFDAISITHHGLQYQNDELVQYANEKGLLIIPGVEVYVKSKHVLLLNSLSREKISNFEDLKNNKSENTLVIAPHPYYFVSTCLGSDLVKNIACFDAIEYCHFYYKFINPNRKALKVAKKYNLPVVGNSDAHQKFQFGTTFSYVYAEEKSIPAIIQAIKNGNVEYVSQPPKLKGFVKELIWIFGKLPYLIYYILKKIALYSPLSFFISKARIKKSLKKELRLKRIKKPHVKSKSQLP